MITKELFIRCLENFKTYNEWEHKLYELGINFWERDELQSLIQSFLDLLAYCCNDDRDIYGYNDIDYFIYEQEFGDKSDKYFITEADGTEIKNKTIEDLWNYLVKNHPEIVDNIKKEDSKKDCSAFTEEKLREIFNKNLK